VAEPVFGLRGRDNAVVALLGDIAADGHRLSRTRLRSVANASSVQTRAGNGWFAVRSGAFSNDLNGVVADAEFVPDVELLISLQEWFGTVPATWLAATPSTRGTDLLLDAGWTSERTGRWAGRSAWRAEPSDDVQRVTDESGLETWLDVAEECGWFDGPSQRDARRTLAGGLAWPRWVAWRDGRPVGMATGFRVAGLLEIVDVAVVASARRQGVGTALVAGVMAGSPASDCVIAAPSSDGWQLFRSMGFTNVPVTPDVCFYFDPN
jgi:GNAT superfamily N-acetyltransferase